MTAIKKKELLESFVKTEVINGVLALIKKDCAITMDGIAKQCGIAKGSLYNYFKNKDDLMWYVHQAILEPIKQSKLAILESKKDPLTRLHEFIDNIFSTTEDVHLFFRFMQQKRSVALENKERTDIVMRPLIKLCTEGIRKGLFVDVAPDILAEMVYGTVIGPLKILPADAFKQPNLEKIKQDVLRLIDRIIIK